MADLQDGPHLHLFLWAFRMMARTTREFHCCIVAALRTNWRRLSRLACCVSLRHGSASCAGCAGRSSAFSCRSCRVALAVCPRIVIWLGHAVWCPRF
eukprot:scaffold26796_cov30-Tisochrysis_lutea.AAC.3